MGSANLGSRLQSLRLLLPQRLVSARHEFSFFTSATRPTENSRKPIAYIALPNDMNDTSGACYLEPHTLKSGPHTNCLKRRPAYASTPFLLLSTCLLCPSTPS
jgi:hypothetical protein